ncbi:MAG: DUF1320 domain-containing protein [Kiritimatiellales bacterium]
MAYATVEDLEERLTRQRLLTLAGIDADNCDGCPCPDELDIERITAALADASAEANVYLNARYAMPLTFIPEALKNAVCDIAAYLLGNETTISDFITERRDNAVALLRRIGEGKADLGIPEAQKPGAAGGDAFIEEGRSDFKKWRL